jgi:hypothetical protein
LVNPRVIGIERILIIERKRRAESKIRVLSLLNLNEIDE